MAGIFASTLFPPRLFPPRLWPDGGAGAGDASVVVPATWLGATATGAGALVVAVPSRTAALGPVATAAPGLTTTATVVGPAAQIGPILFAAEQVVTGQAVVAPTAAIGPIGAAAPTLFVGTGAVVVAPATWLSLRFALQSVPSGATLAAPAASFAIAAQPPRVAGAVAVGKHTVSDRIRFAHTVSDRAIILHTSDDLVGVG